MSMIKGLVAYFVKYPILANILIALTLLGGIVSFLNTRMSFFPTSKDRVINITVAYPGASPEEMEEGVTTKIEEALKSTAGIDEINSTSSENSASISILTLDNFDIDEIYTEVKNAVDGISSFPAGAEKPIVYKQRQRSTAQWLGLTGDVSLKTLKEFAESIEDELLATGVISQVNVSGFPPLEISIEVSEETLRRYNLRFDEVVAAVRLNNRDISAGSVKSKTEEILIRSKAKETEADQIGEIVVRSNADGTKLLLRDIAEIKEQFADQPSKALLNGEQAVFLEVRKLETEDLTEISETVSAYVEKFNEQNSAVQLTTTWDFNNMLNQRLDLLTSNGLVGLLLVLISLGLFLSIRLSIWVAWGIPASFLGMFILGSFVGLTVNMISLFGMILVIGILVDDGIVIAENIYAHFEKSKNPIQAAVRGTLEVLPAVFTSVTTTIVAFLPLLFLTGGFEFLKDMAYVVIFSLAFSLLEAFFILPAHLASKSVLSVKKEDTRSFKIRSAINGFIDYLRYQLYGKALQFCMKYRAVSLAMLFGFIAIIVGLLAGGQIKATFFPQIPFNSFNINISFKPGEREQKVEAYLERFNEAVWKVNDDMKSEFETDEDIVTYTFTNVGFSGDGESGSHAGNVNVMYEELDKYGINQFDLIGRIRKEIGPVPEADKFSIGGGNRWGKPVSVMLLGKNYDELRQAKEFLKAELENIPDLKEIQDNVPIGRREMLFDLRPEAYFLGLTHDDITRQMRQGFFGEEAQRFMKGNDELRVWVRYPDEDRSSIGQLEDIKIKTADGKSFPLTQVADYQIERGVSGIRHYNTSRAVTVEADLHDPFAEVPPIISKIQDTIIPELKARFPSVNVDYGGQSKESARAGQEIGLYFGGAFLLIFFILMITFRSFYQALLITLMIPLGWFGAMFGHGVESWISGRELPVSLLSVWGMVALSGVIINDAVVFLSKFNSLIKEEGQSVYQAAYNAGIARFRAIMLTSLTTVLGLYPLIKETSFQAQFLIPMAISVAYGVLIGTFIILLFFPVFILLFNDIRRAIVWFWTGEKPSREEVERVLLDEKRLEEYRESA
ncbi:efflux RND transporter permease subunit [Marinoscillum furvescens]|uniref:Multidrug efflux pump subunit AcrB n=1 Tax=Marinoscillum furvescens DSM 4134 TaxID=1122208 RepID=A0A3D9L728_MARFU|nr:efflux RND transporter permease subunit [Marinoscillum furvescens]REE02161.1 multidrug efflux pump subunit AcrB [Marinoscillum furvescens DSM 4134]